MTVVIVFAPACVLVLAVFLYMDFVSYICNSYLSDTDTTVFAALYTLKCCSACSDSLLGMLVSRNSIIV